jgi:ketosteroid isomerase-like protein
MPRRSTRRARLQIRESLHRIVGSHGTGAIILSDSQEQLLRRVYEGFNARDIDGVLALMHADVDWPNGMEGGRVHGHREVRSYWQRQFELIDSHVQPQRFEQRPDGQVVVTVRQVVRDLTGNVISEDTLEHRYAISEGLIERMDISVRAG